MAHQRYRTKAVFLKKENRSDSDQLFTLLSEDFGKIKVRAKAIRKITSKLRPGAEVFYFSEIEFIQGKNQKILTDAILIDKFEAFRQSPEALLMASKIADTLDVLVLEAEKDRKLWRLLLTVMQNLGRSDPPGFRGGLTSPYFFWRLVALLGYQPGLDKCARCSKKLVPEELFFSPSQGGLICFQCAKSAPCSQSAPLKVETIKALRFFLASPLQEALKLKLNLAVEKNLQDVSTFYFDFLRKVFHK